MLALATALSLGSNGYGYHRDELYFRMLHPSWGYVDEPPLTPLLARLFSGMVDQPWALRIPATIAAVVSVLMVALVARELGGGRGAQALAAWGYAFAALTVVMGHVLLTSTIDLPVWPAVVLLMLRAQLRRQPQWWLAAGLLVGLSTYNKLLIAILLIALTVGIALLGPRRLIWSRWLWGGAVIALVVAVPNIVYQATHHWPQLSMGQALADNNASSVRVSMWPFLLVLLGPPLVPIWVAGVVSLWRRPQWRAVRFVAAAFPVLLVLVFLMGTQFYYPYGLLSVIYAAGCVPTAEWMAGRARRALVIAAVGVNSAVSLLLGLPIVPVGSVGATPIPAINQVAQDSVGWPAYVHEVARVYRGLPAAERQRAVVIASNYGEAGAISRYGDQYGLPPVYSGQNQLYYQARPPAAADVVVFVGGQLGDVRHRFRSCSVRAHLHNGVGVDNEEQGVPVAICRDPIGGWASVWPAIRHED